MGLPTALLLFVSSFVSDSISGTSSSQQATRQSIHRRSRPKFGPSVAESANSEYRWLEWEHQMRRRGFRRCQCLASGRNLENSTISLSIRVRLVRTAASFAEVRSIPLSRWETTLSAQATLLEAVSISR